MCVSLLHILFPLGLIPTLFDSLYPYGYALSFPTASSSSSCPRFFHLSVFCSIAPRSRAAPHRAYLVRQALLSITSFGKTSQYYTLVYHNKPLSSSSLNGKKCFTTPYFSILPSSTNRGSTISKTFSGSVIFSLRLLQKGPTTKPSSKPAKSFFVASLCFFNVLGQRPKPSLLAGQKVFLVVLFLSLHPTRRPQRQRLLKERQQLPCPMFHS